MDERLTIKQVLMMTRDMLKNIGTIPIEEAVHIGVPVSRAIVNLDECVKAISVDEKRIADEEAAKQMEGEDGNTDSK